jgi:hypothetical protein
VTSKVTARWRGERKLWWGCGAAGGLLLAAVACSSEPDEAATAGGTGAAPNSGGAGGTPSAGKGDTGGSSGTASGAAGGSGGKPTAGGAGPGSGGASPNDGGMPGSGGSSGAGGVDPGEGGASGETGGGPGSGGSGAGRGGSASGGSAGMAGSGATGGGLTDVTTFTPAACTTTPTVTTATKIPMVGVATFTTDLAGADRAIIQFGESSTYSLEAPVNWAEDDHRTLILGMPANTEVHYRVVVFAGSSACVGPDATFTTGAPVSGAPSNLNPTQGTSASPVAPGFIIAEFTSWAYIVNKTGKVVWAYKFPVNLSRALMSWDGHFLYAREVGPFNAASGGAIYRVAMDGTSELKLPVTGGTHHDLVAIPSGLAYPAKEQVGACDCIFTAAADGSDSSCLVDLDIVFSKFNPGPGGASNDRCHVNAIRYYSDTKTFSVSDREKDAIAFFSDTGELLGSIGATPASATPNHVKAEGADSTTDSAWRVQHGHDLYEPNKLIVWSNGPFTDGTSKILHYTIEGSSATLDWQYSGTGDAPTLSDAQHLPNGNFLATNSTNGAVHEVDSTGKLVQSFSALSRGYTSHRPTLYGPPPGR